MKCKYCGSRRVEVGMAIWHYPVAVVSGWCQDCGRYGYLNFIASQQNNGDATTIYRRS